jgi:nitric oxide reductase large subunit
MFCNKDDVFLGRAEKLHQLSSFSEQRLMNSLLTVSWACFMTGWFGKQQFGHEDLLLVMIFPCLMLLLAWLEKIELSSSRMEMRAMAGISIPLLLLPIITIFFMVSPCPRKQCNYVAAALFEWWFQ